MFQELKKKYLKRHIIIAVIFIVIGMLFVAIAGGGIKALLTPKANLNELYADEITSSMPVEADIDFIMDYYAYTTENGMTTEKEYFIPVGEEEYMGVVLDKSDLSKADNNMQATWDYIEGDMEALDQFETIHVTGTIVPLEGKEKQYYEEYISDLAWTAEEKEVFLPYVLKVGYVGNFTEDEFGILIVLAVAFVIVGLIFLVVGLTGNSMKNIKKYCEASGNVEVTKAKLEQFYARTPEVCGIRVSPEYFLSTRGHKALIAESKNIVWVYQHVVKHSVNLIPTGRTYSIILVNADGTRIDVSMRNKKMAEEAIEHIARVLPYLFFGYDEQLQQAFRNNGPAMIQAVAERRNQIYPDQTMDVPVDNYMDVSEKVLAPEE